MNEGNAVGNSKIASKWPTVSGLDSGGFLMNCPNCGANLNPGTHRCDRCGSVFAAQTQQPVPQQPASHASAQPGQVVVQVAAAAPGQPAVLPDLNRKSRIAAGILGILLGGLGIHRFYLGYSGIGIAQIVVTIITAGFGAIWGFIEGIMILTGSINKDARGIPLA